jgi:hypothetical protein
MLNEGGVPVTPAGSPAIETSTVPLKEFTAAADTLTCEPVPPAWRAMDTGDRDNEKSEGLDLAPPQDCSSVAAAKHPARLIERMRGNRINFSPEDRPVVQRASILGVRPGRRSVIALLLSHYCEIHLMG